MLALAGEVADGAIAFVGPARAGRARQQVGATAPGFDFLLAEVRLTSALLPDVTVLHNPSRGSV